MIYTLTLNPSVDYYMDFENPTVGSLNRSRGEALAFGGKGINVSRMLKRLGQNNCAVVAAGGFTGSALTESIKQEGIEVVCIPIKGITRINVKLPLSQTELNAAGPEICEKTTEELYKAFNSAKKGDIAVLSGSVCRGFDKNIYAELTHMLNNKGVITAVDADGEVLKAAAGAKPFLLKPNLEELGRLFNTEITDVKTAERYGKLLVEGGNKNILISMGSKGALLVNESGSIYRPAPQINAVNTVGAGDCLLAGFIHSYAQGLEAEKSLALSVACASARAARGEFPEKDFIMEIYDKM